MPKLVLIDGYGDARIADIPTDCRSIIINIPYSPDEVEVRVRYDDRELDDKLELEDYGK
jgi:hypothetical protein